MRKLVYYNSLFESNQYVKQLLKDGRVSPIMLDFFKFIDPSSNKKFVPWIVRQYLKDENQVMNSDTKDLLDKYLHYVEHNLTDKRDINMFKDIVDLKNHIDEISHKKSNKELRKEKSIIVDNDFISLYRPTSNESCRQLAFSVFNDDNIDPKWCVIPKNSLEWNNYYLKKKFTFYFLKFKKLPEEYKNDHLLVKMFNDVYYKSLGMAIKPDGHIDHIENKKPGIQERILTRSEIHAVVDKKWGLETPLSDLLLPYNVENRI